MIKLELLLCQFQAEVFLRRFAGAVVEVLAAYGGALVLELLEEFPLRLFPSQKLERVRPRNAGLVSIAFQVQGLMDASEVVIKLAVL